MSSLLGPRDSGTRLYFGNPGTGKTWLARHDALASGRPTVVFDSQAEWLYEPKHAIDPQVAHWLRADKRRTVAVVETCGAYAAARKRGTALVVVQTFDAGNRDEILESALKQEGIAIVIHELDTVGYGNPSLYAIASRWRHKRLAAYLDTQRPARIPRTVTEIATQTHAFMLAGPRDRAALAELATDPVAFARAHEAVCSAHSKGVRGVHIALTEAREPPYTPRTVRAKEGA